MHIIVTLSVLLLVELATPNPVSEEAFISITDFFYNEKYVTYAGENEITKIVLSLNSINDKFTNIPNIDVFFIETGKGLNVLKNGVATKVLDNGRDISESFYDGSKTVFFGATDGIYTFNADTRTAEKYGTLTDNIKNIAAINGTKELFILTIDNVLYIVTDDGTKKEEVSDVKDAQQFVLDTSMNLYFFDSKKQVYVKNSKDGKLQEVEGLPKDPETADFIKPSLLLKESIPIVVDNRVYRIKSDGNSSFTGLVLHAKPTAFAAIGNQTIHLAHNKKIYQYSRDDFYKLLEIEPRAIIVSSVDGKGLNTKEAAESKHSSILIYL